MGAELPTRNVVLTDLQAAMVEQLVESGRCQNASEVLREGLRLLQQREAEDEARLVALREAVRVGQDDIDAGRYRTFSDGERVREHLAERAAKISGGEPDTRHKAAR